MSEIQEILDEFEHECFMLRVEAAETHAKDDVVNKSYERIRNEFAGRIAERYMELPVDADGVPIRVGDKIEHRGHTGDVWLFGANEIMCTDRVCYPIGECHRVKPRTLEDVLKELASDVRKEWINNAPIAEHIYTEYADRIRELLEVGA